MLKHCNKVDILDKNDKVITTSNMTLDSTGGIVLMLSEYIEVTENYRLRFYDGDDGIITCKCNLSKPIMLSRGMYYSRCKILEILNKNQRRQDLKIEIQMDCMIDTYLTPNKQLGFIDDISAGGIHLCTDTQLSVGTRIGVTLNKLNITSKARVLREDKPKKTTKYKYGYGCRFENLKASEESQIRQFVFTQQLKRMRE